MKIDLTPEQETWLTAHVASGDFESMADAIRSLIDERIAEEDDDLAWAKPLVEEAERAIERGEVMTLEEHRARNAARLQSLKR